MAWWRLGTTRAAAARTELRLMVRAMNTPPGRRTRASSRDEGLGVGHVLEDEVADGEVDRGVIERPAAVGADEAELVDDRVLRARRPRCRCR